MPPGRPDGRSPPLTRFLDLRTTVTHVRIPEGLSRKPRRIDLAEQDAANRGPGHLGEKLVGGRSRADGDIRMGSG